MLATLIRSAAAAAVLFSGQLSQLSQLSHRGPVAPRREGAASVHRARGEAARWPHAHPNPTPPVCSDAGYTTAALLCVRSGMDTVWGSYCHHPMDLSLTRSPWEQVRCPSQSHPRLFLAGGRPEGSLCPMHALPSTLYPCVSGVCCCCPPDSDCSPLPLR